MRTGVIAALVALLSLCGCGAEDLYTSDYACRFVFNAKYHPGTTIETALNSPGVYTMISAGKVGGVWHIYSTLNDGQDNTEDIRLNTAEENYADYSDLGAANGIIIGQCRYFDVTTGRPVLVAWDRQCANCLRDHGGLRYPLRWTGNGQSVECANCGRIYALETGAVTEGDPGISLFRYRISYAGIGSVVSVGN